MKSSVLAKIKTKRQPGVLFEMASIFPAYMSDPMLKKEVLRLCKAKELMRFCYGLYYLPGDGEPALIDAIKLRYLSNGNEVYGVYSGQSFLRDLKGFSIDENQTIEISTNKETSGKKNMAFGNVQLILKKPYIKIDKYNAAMVALFSYLAYASLKDIDENSSLLSSYVRNNHLSAIEAAKVMDKFPGKVAKKLLKTDLYRSFWKH